MTATAIIGGSGLTDYREGGESLHVDTPFGKPSAAIKRYDNCLFLARHGADHSLAPHRVNYRSNLWALKEAGAKEVVAVNAVGAISPAFMNADLVLPDQLIDYTYGREHTFFDGSGLGGFNAVDHIDFTEPYTAEVRHKLITASASIGQPMHLSATYAATQGPRLETAAEVQRLKQDGCDIIGMTAMPEAALARELGLSYASICIVVNPAAGIGSEQITMGAIMACLEEGVSRVKTLLAAYLD